MGYVCHMVPSIWVMFYISDVPQNGSVSESLTHTSWHRLVKSTPRGILIVWLKCKKKTSAQFPFLMLRIDNSGGSVNEVVSKDISWVV